MTTARTAAPHPDAALWVHAHPRRGSLNARLFREGVDALRETHRVATSDLYADGFDPVLRASDLGTLAETRGNIAEQLGDAYAAGQLAAEVREEQGKIADAELLVLQFPLWWYGVPAMLKGWFDRVFTAGFALGDLDPELGVPRRYGDGGLTGRKALIIVTAGEDARSIGPRGISGDLDSLLFPVTHGVLWYVGIESYDLHVIHDADALDEAAVEHEVERLRARLASLGTEPTRGFRRLRDGDYRGTRALRDDLAPGRLDLHIHRRDDDAALEREAS
ncbi:MULTISPECIES: NAD(P)H-dependent oxidoreductase [unclassified Agrococcus]|uniref:NAD(P)H-dependent oxidoreductase n=1 Tax=unclassified Agrococcus TaxID=2615065 RepID=UPI0036131EE5